MFIFVCSHEVKLNILFESATNMELVGVDSTVEPTCQLFSTFVYLDTEEVRPRICRCRQTQSCNIYSRLCAEKEIQSAVS